MDHYWIPGCRFVELLWQLSVHALREVHKRTFAADVASNPLPPALTDASYQHAAALLPVTKLIGQLARQAWVVTFGIKADLVFGHAMDPTSHVPYSGMLSVSSGEMSSPVDVQEQMNLPHPPGKSETLSKMVDRGGIVHPTVDVAEILRRWTHALQRIHKQSLHLLEKASTNPVLKLPHLISLAPNSSGKSTHTPKRTAITTQSIQESLPVGTSAESQFTNDQTVSGAKAPLSDTDAALMDF
ncbi:hypothetical protein BHM03_00041606 [Ensete ventricosum]|nr:hypothetical protein BHM03_00041606 [Ensete ventricosum]